MGHGTRRVVTGSKEDGGEDEGQGYKGSYLNMKQLLNRLQFSLSAVA